MSEIAILQKEIREQFGEDGARMMDVLDGMALVNRLPLLRRLIQLETVRLQRHIEDLNALLPLEDRG